MTDESLPLDEQRSRLERRANVIRSRLLRTIDALDSRRHQVTEIGHHAKRLAVPALVSVIGAAVVTAGATFAVRALVERRRERNFGYRVSKALAPLRQQPRRPFWRAALRRVTLAALGIVASELVKRGVHGVLHGRGPGLDGSDGIDRTLALPPAPGRTAHFGSETPLPQTQNAQKNAQNAQVKE